MRLSKSLLAVTLGAVLFSTNSAYAQDEHKAEEKKGEEKKGEEGKKAEGGHKGEEGHHGSERLPLSLAERPLTLPKFVLNPELALVFERTPGIEFEPATGAMKAIHENEFGMELGAHFGITDDLEVGAIVLPVHFTPVAAYGNPLFEGTFRFLKQSEFEMGARLGVTIVPGRAGGPTGAIIQPGVPALLRIGKAARLDAGVFLPISVVGPSKVVAGPINVTTKAQAAVGLNIPIRFIYDIIEPLHVGARTGLQIADFGHAGSTILVPLQIVAGYAIKGDHGPIVDIDPFFGWNGIVNTSLPGKADAGGITVGVAVGGFFYF